jgi:hypothetical protein
MAYIYHEQARSRAAASQNPPFPNNLRTRPGSDVPLADPYQQRPPWMSSIAAGRDSRAINLVRPPASRRNDDFSDTASLTSPASSSFRSSYYNWTNPTTNRQNYQNLYPSQLPARRRNDDFSDTASVTSTTSSSSRSSYSSWNRT